MLLDNNGNATFGYTPPSLRTRSQSRARDKMHAAKMFKRAIDNDRWLALHFTSHDNPYLPREGLVEIEEDMTALNYRMEIMAEDIEDAPGSLWKRHQFGRDRIRPKPDDLVRVVVGVDPAGSRGGNAIGIIVGGIDQPGSALHP